MPQFSENVEIQNGYLILRHSTGPSTIQANPEKGHLRIGGNQARGDLTMRATDNVRTVHLNGEHGNLALGAAGHDGDLTLASSDGVTTVHLNGEHGNLTLGAMGHDGDIVLRDSQNVDTIHLNGDEGDIVLLNADFAEDFDVRDSETIEPGTVVVLDTEGKLERCTAAYDKKVAGVVSGSGGFKPAIVLDRRESTGKRMPVALVGKVYCKADARYSPIEVGDLVTTSPTAGHAMKATDPGRAFGSVIGKALKPLARGQALIPIVVALQ